MNDNFWESALKEFEVTLDPINYNTWLSKSKLVKKENNHLVIELENEFVKMHICTHLVDYIEETLFNLFNQEFTFEFVIKDEKQKEIIIKEENVDIPKIKNINSNILPKYTFENFMTGEGNKVAQMMALSVAEQPGKLYNPLFIYGKSGLGKTHLMHAIGNYVMSHSDKSVLYVKPDEFLSDFRDISQKGPNNLELTQHFKEKYRNVDVLIIDDIQMLSGANKTQAELFNTFNFLHDLNKQIIISSDRSPDDLKELEERLRQRFTMGLTIRIDPPDYELKIKILKNKVIGLETSKLIKDEVFDYIANNCESDGRHLEGAINRLYACISIYNPEEINLEFAVNSLKDFLGKSIYITNNIKKIQKAVADYYDLSVNTLKSKKRTAIVNNARQIAMYISRMTTDETVEKIGLEYNRNHATVLHAIKEVEKELRTNKELQKQINEIKDKIDN